MAGVVLGDTPTVRAIHSDVTACTSGDKARRAKGKGGGVGVWSSSELGDLKETKAGEKKKEVNKKIIKEIQNQAWLFRKAFLGVLPFSFKIVAMGYNKRNDTSMNTLFW